MAERILVNGKFEVYAPAKKKPEIKKLPVIKNVAAIDKDDKKPTTIPGKVVGTLPIEITGDETVKELKLLLKDRNISFAKNAGKEKCLELIAPFLVALDVEDDL